MKLLLLFLLSFLISPLVLAVTPNGLCLISVVSAEGAGDAIGFIVGDKIFSAAHVFEDALSIDIRCQQYGRLVRVQTASPVIHPEYFVHVNGQRVGRRDRDLAYLSILGAPSLVSDFALPRMRTFTDFLNLQRRVYGDTSSIEVVHGLQPHSTAFDEETFSGFALNLFPSHTSYDPRTQSFFRQTISYESQSAQLLIWGTRKIGPGWSGGPLSWRKPGTGRYLVIGIIHGATTEEETGQILIPDEIPQQLAGDKAVEINLTLQLHQWLDQQREECGFWL